MPRKSPPSGPTIAEETDLKPIRFIAALAFTAVLPVATAALAPDDADGHQSYSAGEPGDPAKRSRTIEIEMSEMDYKPFKIEGKRGEQILFVLRNVRTEDHQSFWPRPRRT